MAALSIHLLGDFRLVLDGRPITEINTARLQSLLGYLALHRQAPQSRQYLAFLLWPESTEAQARTNLRKALYDLRHALPVIDDFVLSDSTNLQWHGDKPCAVDVSSFEELLAQAEHASEQQILRNALEQALALYVGDLLPACYDDWVITERERLLQRYLRSLEQLTSILEGMREYGKAIGCAQRLLHTDPLQESAYRILMRLYMQNGDHARALRVYHTCATVLLEELGADPGPDMKSAYQRLLQIDASSATPTAVKPSAQRQRLPLVGRRQEWAAIQDAWRAAAIGEPQLVLIAGEAGIGKTYLAEEFRQWADRQGCITAKARSYAAEGKLAYAPVADWLRTDAIYSHLAQLEDVWQGEVARLLPDLLATQPDLPPPQPLTDSWQRQRFREALARAVQQKDRALLLVLDDLQWCDQETLEWLHYLLRFDPQAQLLLVGTVRTEEVQPDHPLHVLIMNLRQNGKLTEIELGPLDLAESGELASCVAGIPLEPHYAAALYAETEGYPLFVVEMVRARAADTHGAWPTTWPPADLPARVQAVIHFRLDQLTPAAHTLASLAAVVGRAFAADVLRHASEGDEEALVQGLDELWQRRIIRTQGQRAYDFSHDKIREIAYREISPARRLLLHRRVAQALEAVYAAELDAVSGQIAVQYEQAGMALEAAAYYQRAAAAAQQMYAHAQASAQLEQGVALLKCLPATVANLQQELQLQQALAVSLTACKAVSALVVKDAYARAHSLAQQVGDERQRLLAAAGLVVSELTRGEIRTAQELVLRYLPPVEQIATFAGLMNIAGLAGIVSMHLGQWRSSYHQLEQAQAQGHDPWDARTSLTWAQHQGTVNRRHQVIVLWHLGYPERALRQMVTTLALAQDLGHPYNLAAVLVWTAWLHQVRREPALVLEQAAKGIALAEQQGFRYWLSYFRILEGWAFAHRGQAAQGIAKIEAGLAERLAMEAGVHRPTFLGMLAEAYGAAGQPERGLSVLEEALSLVAATGERFSEAELHCIRGDLLQMQAADAARIEACFQQSLAISCRQETKAIELRAALGLARLWQRQRRPQQAYDLLAPILSAYREGFDTPDLQDASRILRSLST